MAHHRACDHGSASGAPIRATSPTARARWTSWSIGHQPPLRRSAHAARGGRGGGRAARDAPRHRERGRPSPSL